MALKVASLALSLLVCECVCWCVSRSRVGWPLVEEVADALLIRHPAAIQARSFDPTLSPLPPLKTFEADSLPSQHLKSDPELVLVFEIFRDFRRWNLKRSESGAAPEGVNVRTNQLRCQHIQTPAPDTPSGLWIGKYRNYQVCIRD